MAIGFVNDFSQHGNWFHGIARAKIQITRVVTSNSTCTNKDGCLVRVHSHDAFI